MVTVPTSPSTAAVPSTASSPAASSGRPRWAAWFPRLTLATATASVTSAATSRPAFLGDAGCDFDIISAAQKRGTFLAGLSVGGKMGPVDLRIGYEGEFNSDITSHAGNFKFVLPLGGKKEAAAAPAPVLAPPMPPAEVARRRSKRRHRRPSSGERGQ